VTPSIKPKRGEVWRVQLEPVRGSEQGKTRPVVIISEKGAGRPTVRLCAPLVNAKPEHGLFYWCIVMEPDAQNGLTKDSTADASQTRALDTVRFEARLGSVTDVEVELIADALIQCVKQPQKP
jgi:mRNA interferase MazF